MKISFVKGSGKHDRMIVHRDGAEESVECPKQGIIPHDMVHFAVESTLLKRGFLSRVRDGEAANFRMVPEAESDGVERLVEVIQGDAWSGGNAATADMLDLYQVTCRARVAELDAEWKSVPVGQSLVLEL